MKIILASGSPRRRQLMRQAGYSFEVMPSNVSERVKRGLGPAQVVRELALKKARAIAKRFPSRPVLAADTLVYINGRVVGKPRNPKHAIRILQELSGHWQKVYTGVAFIYSEKRIVRCSATVSHVKMRTLTVEEIASVSHRHLDKAGGYAVQEKEDSFVERIRGDYDNVVGLPMRVVKKYLRLIA